MTLPIQTRMFESNNREQEFSMGSYAHTPAFGNYVLYQARATRMVQVISPLKNITTPFQHTLTPHSLLFECILYSVLVSATLA